MKLLYCLECDSVFNLALEMEKVCVCGKSKGQYTDNLNAWFKGPCLPLGFHNGSLSEALQNQPLKDKGKEFTAFVIQKKCSTMKRIGKAPKLSKPENEQEKITRLFNTLNQMKKD